MPANDPPADGRSFFATKAEFFSRLVRDRGLTGMDIRVGWVILDHVNTQSLLAWPSNARMAEILGLADPTDLNNNGIRMVRRAAKRLVERGHFEIVERGGAGGRGSDKSTVYRPNLVGTAESPLELSLWGQGSPPGGDSDGRLVGTGESPEPFKEPLKEPVGKKRRVNRTVNMQLEEQFEAWWRQFPRGRRNAKKKALQKYLRIVNDGTATPEQLLEGLMRYAAAVGDNNEFVCMPSTWLNNERWNDEDPGGPPSKGKGKAGTGKPDLAHIAMTIGRGQNVH